MACRTTIPSAISARRTRRNHPLAWDQKLANRGFSCVRIVVENTLKHFQDLAQQFRHAVGI